MMACPATCGSAEKAGAPEGALPKMPTACSPEGPPHPSCCHQTAFAVNDEHLFDGNKSNTMSRMLALWVTQPLKSGGRPWPQ